MSDKRDLAELATPAIAAKQLQISVATLRKYSLIVEKVTSNSNYFERTKQKSRLYSQKNIADLKDFKALAKKGDLTLQEAARQIFAISNKAEDDAKKVEAAKMAQQEVLKNTVVDANQVVKLLNMLQQTIANQNQAIQDLQRQVARVEKQNQKLIDESHRLAQPGPKEDIEVDPKIAAMPDVSGIVEEDEELLTPEQKKAKIAAEIATDKKKSKEEVHDEILRKACENQEKRAKQNIHRTLADMQVPQKTHWWERLFK